MPQMKNQSKKISRFFSLGTAFVLVAIRDTQSSCFSTAPDLSPTESGGAQAQKSNGNDLVSSVL